MDFKQGQIVAATDEVVAAAQPTNIIQLSGAWVGTMKFQMSPDNGSSWYDVAGRPASGGTSVPSATGNGSWIFPGSGFNRIKVTVGTFVSGPVNVTITGAEGAYSPSELIDDWLGVASAEFTRPADTAVYASRDVIADSTSTPSLMTFNNLARFKGGSGYLSKARLMTDNKAWFAQCKLHLYHTAPTPIADNAPFTILYANRANRIGHILFDLLASEDATNSTAAYTSKDNIRLPFICAAGSANLFGILTTLDAQTPASGQNFFVELTADQN